MSCISRGGGGGGSAPNSVPAASCCFPRTRYPHLLQRSPDAAANQIYREGCDRHAISLIPCHSVPNIFLSPGSSCHALGGEHVLGGLDRFSGHLRARNYVDFLVFCFL